MRTWLLISLLFLSVIIHEAQGIRLRKETSPDRQHNIHKIIHLKRSNDGVAEANLCKGKQCSGKIRKLIVTAVSSTTTNAKNDKNEENKSNPEPKGEKFASKDENLSVNSSSKAEPGPDNYPDILDIAGMDYSQARRKPPIHN